MTKRVLAAVGVFLVCALGGGASAQESMFGVFHERSGAYDVTHDDDWTAFESTWSSLSGAGLRLIDVETVERSGQRLYSGVWQAGSDGYGLWLSSQAGFEAQITAWESSQRLIDFERFEEGGGVRYIGVWRSGTDAYAFVTDLDWSDFVTEWEAQSAAGKRLIDVETWDDGGTRRYGGIFRAGTDGYYLYGGIDQATLIQYFEDLGATGFRLVDVEKYDDGSGDRYVAVWRESSQGSALWFAGDRENFDSQMHALESAPFRPVDIELCPGCEALCANQVVSSSGYRYQVTGGGLYDRPVDSDAEGDWVRNSAVSFPETPNWLLPFNDSRVRRGGTWLYEPDNWHHAIDFYVPGFNDSFLITASSAGTVVGVGWDNWSGNYVEVSHTVGGQQDAFRTIYMHLRNGAANDCSLAWSQSVPAIGGQSLIDYKAHLNASGCTENPDDRSLDPIEWGSESQTTQVQIGETVVAEQVLGFAGNTGPGGKRGSSLPHANVHLHIFYARQDPTDNNWYFVDPYGIYGPGWNSGCYPAALSDPITGPCARYPNLWLGGQPQLAPEPRFVAQMAAGVALLAWLGARRRRSEIARSFSSQ